MKSPLADVGDCVKQMDGFQGAVRKGICPDVGKALGMGHIKGLQGGVALKDALAYAGDVHALLPLAVAPMHGQGLQLACGCLQQAVFIGVIVHIGDPGRVGAPN